MLGYYCPDSTIQPQRLFMAGKPRPGLWIPFPFSHYEGTDERCDENEAGNQRVNTDGQSGGNAHPGSHRAGDLHGCQARFTSIHFAQRYLSRR